MGTDTNVKQLENTEEGSVALEVCIPRLLYIPIGRSRME
jgi:hypothetical protein